jgi:hypothetical protein
MWIIFHYQEKLLASSKLMVKGRGRRGAGGEGKRAGY